jgi:hypothetical protein
VQPGVVQDQPVGQQPAMHAQPSHGGGEQPAQEQQPPPQQREMQRETVQGQEGHALHGDAVMLPAPPLAAAAVEPAQEPGFGVAIEYVTDRSDALRSDAVTLVQAVRTHSPSVYAAIRDASAPGDLSRPFREALYSQARGLFGEERALQLQVLPALPLGEGMETDLAVPAAGQGSQQQTGPPAALVRITRSAAASAAASASLAASSAIAPPPASSDEEQPEQRRCRRVPRAGGGITFWQGSTQPPPPPPRNTPTKTHAKPAAKAVPPSSSAATPGQRSGAGGQRRPSA